MLLRRLEGFDGRARSTLVCATNRPEDVDPALLSRFGATIDFPLPAAAARVDIWQFYTKHLTPKQHEQLGQLAASMSARDIKHVRRAAVHSALTTRRLIDWMLGLPGV